MDNKELSENISHTIDMILKLFELWGLDDRQNSSLLGDANKPFSIDDISSRLLERA